MRFLIALTSVLFGAGSFAAETAPEWRSEKCGLDMGSYKAAATLTVGMPTVARGAKFEVDIRFSNSSGGDYFYNPFFNRLVPLPARLAIFDSQHKYLGDLLHWEGGSQAVINAGNWTYVPGDCSVGRSVTFHAGYVPGTKYGVTSNLLPPGTYYLQMIYFKAFVAHPLTDTHERQTQFYKTFDRAELFRSNVATIRFTTQ